MNPPFSFFKVPRAELYEAFSLSDVWGSSWWRSSPSLFSQFAYTTAFRLTLHVYKKLFFFFSSVKILRMHSLVMNCVAPGWVWVEPGISSLWSPAQQPLTGACDNTLVGCPVSGMPGTLSVARRTLQFSPLQVNQSQKCHFQTGFFFFFRKLQEKTFLLEQRYYVL